jgi:hypothetical protein
MTFSENKKVFPFCNSIRGTVQKKIHCGLSKILMYGIFQIVRKLDYIKNVKLITETQNRLK